MQNTIVKEFEGNADVVTLLFNQGSVMGEDYDWMKTFWDNLYLRGTVVHDATWVAANEYLQPNTNLPFGRGFIIDRDGTVALPYFGHNPGWSSTRSTTSWTEHRCRVTMTGHCRVSRPWRCRAGRIHQVQAQPLLIDCRRPATRQSGCTTSAAERWRYWPAGGMRQESTRPPGTVSRPAVRASAAGSTSSGSRRPRIFLPGR